LNRKAITRIRHAAWASLFPLVFLAAQEAPQLTFEVASVKLNRTDTNGNHSIDRAPAGQLKAENTPVKMLIRFAYTLGDYQILNAPGWTESEGYDILAKPAPGAEPDPWASEEGQRRLRERTKALLAGRFGLQAHIESRESPIYALVVAKGGPKLKPSAEKQMQISTNNTNVICTRATMARFAAIVLCARMGRAVVDRTGLAGEYDFRMDFVPDPVPGKSGGDSTPTGPSFITALQEQLGLRLEPAKGPADFLVIDHVERPSAN
jgi:uncharacterized protein (TIGR03435 family)